jgi:alpha-L-fucosidase
MRYVNITSRHHEGFCLFASGVTDYTSAAAPARRDLVGELAEQCAAKGLGLFLYYSYALDWRHPYFYPRSYFRIARPDYPEGELRYLFRRDEDFRHYVAFVHAQLRELLTGYGPLAGIWLDPIMGYYARPDLYPIEETYALIRSLQPQTLISFKQGASGDEDFTAPERGARSLEENVRRQCGEAQALVARRAWDGNTGKPRESCNTLQPHSWGYMQADDGKHRTSDDVLALLAEGREQSWNLLLNTGPLPDGSIQTEDVATLREVGIAF